ncbi:MAG: CHC2 zinc finger domain-containing protein [Chloroflexota bacterium]
MADVEEIRARTNLADIVKQTVQLRRSGEQWVGRCPFHEDRSASLSVSDKFYKCHAACCGKQGDVFTWVGETYGLDFQGALRKVQELTGLPASNGRGQAPGKPAELPKTLARAVAEQYHRDLAPERREYYRRRGLGDETIDEFLLGWDGTRYTIPVFVGGQLLNVRRRRDDQNKRDRGPKMLNTAGYGTAVLYNQDALQAAESAVIAEGEFDAMLLTQHGWTAVTSTGGADTFKPEWAPLFATCQTIYVCYDNDLAGRSGAAKVAALFGERARIVALPDEVGDKGDVTDFFVALGKTDNDFASLLAEAAPYEPPVTLDSEPALRVHLAQSAGSDLVGKKVEVHVLCAGKMDAPYIVPRKVRYTCWAPEKEREQCGAADDERAAGYWDKTFDDRDPTFIELCHKKNEQIEHLLKKAAGCRGACRKVSCEPLEWANVEEVLAVPMADRVLPSAESDRETDESGNEYVARNLYLLDEKATVNQYYRVTGRVYPHPNTQLGTILVTAQKPLEDNIAQFALSEEVKRLFGVFQPGPRDLVEHVNRLLEDLTLNVTHIYKRDEALLAVLLCYHSVLNFEWQGRPIRRGWLEVLLLGDTGLGKTELVRSLIEWSGLGMLISGETSRRTGICYSVQQVGERWFVKWGKYVLNDRRLLAIDELSELPEEDLGRMTQGRNDGVMRVEQAGVGEANCRTRLIWMSNPRWGKGLYSFSHGVEALKGLFPSPADLRRLDLAVFLATKDVDLEEINRLRAKPTQQLVSAEALKQSVLWAWSRRAGDVVIDEEATAAMLAEASRLSRVYGSAEDVPLVSPADMRNKLARLAVALAALLHSTDGSHEKVLVTPEHVRFIGLYLDSVYRAKNCRYDIYAGYAAKKANLDEVEIRDISQELRDVEPNLDGSASAVSEGILALYRQHDVLTATELADLLDIDRRTVAKRLKVLQRHALISKTRGGYHKTPKFVEYLSAT